MKKNILFYVFIASLSAIFFSSCDKDDEVINELTIDKSEVSTLINEKATVNIISGNGEYVVTSGDKKIATAIVQDQTIEVTGKAQGETNITVTDKKGKTVSFKVCIYSNLNLEENEVIVFINEKATVNITSGNGEYVVTSGDENIVTATVQNQTIEVTGKAKGETNITVTDKKAKTVKLKVKVYPVLAIEKDEVSLNESETVSVAITSGSGNYSITSNDEAIAKATKNENAIKIEGVKSGKTTITIKDTDTNKEQTLNVTVNKKQEVLFNIDENGLVTKKDGANISGDIVMPDNAKTLDYGLLRENDNITSIDFNNVETIGGFCVYKSYGLTSITLGEKTKLIKGSAFYGDKKLKTVICKVQEPSMVTIENFAFLAIHDDVVLYVPVGTLDKYKNSKFADSFTKIEEIK